MPRAGGIYFGIQLAALWLRGRRRTVRGLEDLCAYRLFDTCVAYAKEARAIGRVGQHSGFEYTDDLEKPQGVVRDLCLFRSEHVNRFVLSDWHFATVIPQCRHPTEHEERQVRRPGGNNEPKDLDFPSAVRLDALGHFEVC